MDDGLDIDEDEDEFDEMAFDEDEDEDEEGFFISSDECDDFQWLESMYARAIMPNPEKEEVIASCHAKLIRQASIVGNFYDDMEEPTQWT
jgi:hypothetical protein